jgi:hypothetical protein
MASMPLHSGPATALIALLLVAGTQKLIDPSSTSGALRAADLPGSIALVRLLALAEMGVAVAFLVWGGPVPAALGALLYAGFAGFVVNAIWRDLPISSCGCLGATETPPTMVHVVLNLGATVVLAFAAIIPIGPLGGLVGQEVRTVLPFVLFTGVTVYLLYAMLAILPLVSRRAISRLPSPLATPVRRAR